MNIRFLIFSFMFIQHLSGQTDPDSMVRHLDSEEFYIQMQLHHNHIIIDTRTYDEFRIERIPGAFLAENRKELYRITDTLDLDSPVFVYCSDNIRSITASEMIVKKGFTNVFNLKEGMIGWKRNGLTLDTKELKFKLNIPEFIYK